MIWAVNGKTQMSSWLSNFRASASPGYAKYARIWGCSKERAIWSLVGDHRAAIRKRSGRLFKRRLPASQIESRIPKFFDRLQVLEECLTPRASEKKLLDDPAFTAMQAASEEWAVLHVCSFVGVATTSRSIFRCESGEKGRR